MPQTLNERTRRQVRALFALSDVDAVERILVSECGANLPGLAGPDHLERIRSAAVRFSGGLLEGLTEAIRLAQLDWRDLLMGAGFADDPTAHTRWEPRSLSARLLNDWLAGAALPGVRFSRKDPVMAMIRPGDARAGSVIGLQALEPEPRYSIELGSGEHLLAFQRNLESVD